MCVRVTGLCCWGPARTPDALPGVGGRLLVLSGGSVEVSGPLWGLSPGPSLRLRERWRTQSWQLAAAPKVPLPLVQPSCLSGPGTVGHTGAHTLLPLCGGWHAEPGWAWATASWAGKLPGAQRGLRPHQQDEVGSQEVRAAAPRLLRRKTADALGTVVTCVQTSSR